MDSGPLDWIQFSMGKLGAFFSVSALIGDKSKDVMMTKDAADWVTSSLTILYESMILPENIIKVAS